MIKQDYILIKMNYFMNYSLQDLHLTYGHFYYEITIFILFEDHEPFYVNFYVNFNFNIFYLKIIIF